MESGAGDVARQPEPANNAESNCVPQQTPATAPAAQSLHPSAAGQPHKHAALVEARTKEIHQTAMSFAKNQPHLRFQATGSSFMQFRMQFEAFLEQLQCEHVLSSKPGDAVPGVPAELHAAQQSNVYYMLTIAAPKEAQAGLRSACERTAYDAWKLLRDRFLGEEAAYKQQLMLQFASLRWLPKEAFTTFDARFTSLIAELELFAGEEKSAEDKQAAILRAIQTRDGPHSATDYMRMRNVSNALTFAAVGAGRSVPFETWLSHMRDEARAIEEQQRMQHDSHRQQYMHIAQQQRSAGAAQCRHHVQTSNPVPAVATIQRPVLSLRRFVQIYTWCRAARRTGGTIRTCHAETGARDAAAAVTLAASRMVARQDKSAWSRRQKCMRTPCMHSHRSSRAGA